MFPFDVEDEDEVTEVTETEPSDYEINLSTGELTGNIITGIDAIKQWAELVLQTDRYVFPQYTWDYGTDLYSLIGTSESDEYYATEAERMVTEALTTNEYIESIDDFTCSRSGSTLTLSFTITTTYGNTDMEVQLDV